MKKQNSNRRVEGNTETNEDSAVLTPEQRAFAVVVGQALAKLWEKWQQEATGRCPSVADNSRARRLRWADSLACS
jgi:hypothetical protein